MNPGVNIAGKNAENVSHDMDFIHYVDWLNNDAF